MGAAVTGSELRAGCGKTAGAGRVPSSSKIAGVGEREGVCVIFLASFLTRFFDLALAARASSESDA